MDLPENVGIMIETPGVLPGYSGYKNLKFLADICKKANRQTIRDAICRVGLDPELKRHVGKYSLGMRQWLGLAQAIMEDPELLILDEPMNGLDNKGVEDMRRLFLELKERGKTILVASHSKEDIDMLCDTVCEMDSGRLAIKKYFPYVAFVNYISPLVLQVGITGNVENRKKKSFGKQYAYQSFFNVRKKGLEPSRRCHH